MPKALIFWGGWPGHEPEQVSAVFAEFLKKAGFEVEASNTLDCLLDERKLMSLDLIVPNWTAGDIKSEQLKPLLKAVGEGGVGIAGVHGGMGDSFRTETEYHLMVGGQWVAHPGGIVDYRVHMVDHADEVTAGLNHFNIKSEQYYMHVDPSNHVLATTTFEHNGTTMPVAWKRTYGKGRVFYSSLGHVAKDLSVPEVYTIITRGMLWAACSD